MRRQHHCGLIIFTLAVYCIPAAATPSTGGAFPAGTQAAKTVPVPLNRDLFVNESWYQSQEGAEQTFEGILRRDNQNSAIGFGRHNRFRLEMAASTREVYVGGAPNLLEPYINCWVRLTGKPVDMDVEGQDHHEIWPARLEVLSAAGGLHIIAQGDWPQPVEGPSTPRWAQQWVIRTEAELAQLAGPRGSLVVARSLKTPALDFRSQMLIAVSGPMQPMVGVSGGGPPSTPYQVIIQNIVEDTASHSLMVQWQLVPREGTTIITNPIAVVLVKRFDGPVNFRQIPTVPNPSGPAHSESSLPELPDASAGRKVKIIAGTLWPEGWKTANPPQTLVIRRYADLIDSRMMANENVLEQFRQERARTLARALGVPTIDFTRQMVIAVSGGIQPTGGYRVQVSGIALNPDGKGATVHWKVQGPREGAKVVQELSHPGRILLVDQFNGTIRFDPPIQGPQMGQSSFEQAGVDGAMR